MNNLIRNTLTGLAALAVVGTANADDWKVQEEYRVKTPVYNSELSGEFKLKAGTLNTKCLLEVDIAERYGLKGLKASCNYHVADNWYIGPTMTGNKNDVGIDPELLYIGNNWVARLKGGVNDTVVALEFEWGTEGNWRKRIRPVVNASKKSGGIEGELLYNIPNTQWKTGAQVNYKCNQQLHECGYEVMWNVGWFSKK